jgi:hypothetical protein
MIITINTVNDGEQGVKDAIAILKYSLKASDTEINPMDGSLRLMDKHNQPLAWLYIEDEA